MRLDDPDTDQTRASIKPATANEDGTYRYTLSDESMDSFSTRILVKGWSLKRFLSNPVVPWAHRYDIPPVGRAERVWKSAETGQPPPFTLSSIPPGTSVPWIPGQQGGVEQFVPVIEPSMNVDWGALYPQMSGLGVPA